jgi:hypothetical protein
MTQRHRNLCCSFRAPNEEWFQAWLEFKQVTKSQGLDICYVLLNLCRVWTKAQRAKEANCQIKTTSQVVTIYQTNTFNYNVRKPRRERFRVDCSARLSRCTLCSQAFQAYILEKARDLGTSFCFRDFLEINHDLFRKLVLELKKRHKIYALRPRTNPRFFILSERKLLYPTMIENNRVKQFSGEAHVQDDESKSDS